MCHKLLSSCNVLLDGYLEMVSILPEHLIDSGYTSTLSGVLDVRLKYCCRDLDFLEMSSKKGENFFNNFTNFPLSLAWSAMINFYILI